MYALAMTSKRKKAMCCIAYRPEEVPILLETIREWKGDYRTVVVVDRYTTEHTQRVGGEVSVYPVEHRPPERGRGIEAMLYDTTT